MKDTDDNGRKAVEPARFERLLAGLPTRPGQSPRGIDMHRHGGRAWLHLTACRFMFLLFEKRTARASLG